MNFGSPKLSQHTRKRLFGLSPWLVVGLSVVLGLTLIVLSVRNAEREKEHMLKTMLERADALIWALEAGTRTGMMSSEGSKRWLQALIVETARQPGILYMSVVDPDGLILAHSDPERTGQRIPLEKQSMRDCSMETQWRIQVSQTLPALEVYREFMPVRVAPPQSRGSSSRMEHGRPCTGHGMPQSGFAFVGFELGPFEETLASDRYNTILTTAILAVIGFAGFISLFWAHNYQRSRRLLKDTQDLAAEVVACLPVGLITSTPDSTVGMINDVALRMLHTDAGRAVNAPLWELPGLDWKTLADELEQNGKTVDKETELPGEGKPIPIILSASRIRNDEGLFLGHLFIMRDITEMKRLQTEVQRNERLSALGNLATGVAHEIRNPLSSIKGLATYIAGRPQTCASVEEAAKTMILEVDRLNRVVSGLLEFSRPGTMKLTPTGINDVILRALRLAKADISAKSIIVRFEQDETLLRIPINAERVTQALLNLFLNAVQAMDDGGELRITTQADPARNTLSLTVTDNGIGMAQDVLASVFTPYFTTKPSGTGLGLAIVHQIMEGHGGSVQVVSTLGAGSAFTLTFPLNSESQERA